VRDYVECRAVGDGQSGRVVALVAQHHWAEARALLGDGQPDLLPDDLPVWVAVVRGSFTQTIGPPTLARTRSTDR
jgi:hypothetical protein